LKKNQSVSFDDCEDDSSKTSVLLAASLQLGCCAWGRRPGRKSTALYEFGKSRYRFPGAG